MTCTPAWSSKRASQAAAAAAGAPVPHILVADDSLAALGNPFLICDAIAGETIVRRIQRQLEASGGQRAARGCWISAPRRWPPFTGPTRATPPWPGGPTRAVARAARRDGRHHRHLRVGVSLARGQPAPGAQPSRTVLVHGDYRMGNLIVDGSDLAAVLDWELVHVGEAYEDLAWFCIRAWRFGAPAEPWGRAASAASRASSRPTRRPAGPPSIGWRFTGGWCWPRCAGGSSAGTRRSAI